MTYTAAGRFWAKVDASGDCWVWTGARIRGYGVFHAEGRNHRAHRTAWELLIGPIPTDLTPDHRCRVRACVNPAHIEWVTERENILRGYSLSAASSRRTACERGHPYTNENTNWHGPDGRRRACRPCRRERAYRRTHALPPMPPIPEWRRRSLAKDMDGVAA